KRCSEACRSPARSCPSRRCVSAESVWASCIGASPATLLTPKRREYGQTGKEVSAAIGRRYGANGMPSETCAPHSLRGSQGAMRRRIDQVRPDSASFLSERQRIVSFSAFRADSASPRFVSAHPASRDPPVPLPPLHLASGVELLAGDAKPPVR